MEIMSQTQAYYLNLNMNNFVLQYELHGGVYIDWKRKPFDIRIYQSKILSGKELFRSFIMACNEKLETKEIEMLLADIKEDFNILN